MQVLRHIVEALGLKQITLIYKTTNVISEQSSYFWLFLLVEFCLTRIKNTNITTLHNVALVKT